MSSNRKATVTKWWIKATALGVIPFWLILYPLKYHWNTYSDSGVQRSNQGCCLTQRNPTVWKTRQMMIWDKTEHRSGPEIRPDGGLRATSSFQAGFRLTAKGKKIYTIYCIIMIIKSYPVYTVELKWLPHDISHFTLRKFTSVVPNCKRETTQQRLYHPTWMPQCHL